MDFSGQIDQLADAAITAAEENKALYLGKFHKCDLMVRHWGLLIVLTHQEQGVTDAKYLEHYLRGNGWRGCGGIDKIEVDGRSFPYLNVSRITVRKEKFSQELHKLEGLLSSYASVTPK